MKPAIFFKKIFLPAQRQPRPQSRGCWFLGAKKPSPMAMGEGKGRKPLDRPRKGMVSLCSEWWHFQDNTS